MSNVCLMSVLMFVLMSVLMSCFVSPLYLLCISFVSALHLLCIWFASAFYLLCICFVSALCLLCVSFVSVGSEHSKLYVDWVGIGSLNVAVIWAPYGANKWARCTYIYFDPKSNTTPIKNIQPWKNLPKMVFLESNSAAFEKCFHVICNNSYVH